MFVAEEWRRIRAAVVLHRDRIWRACCGFCTPLSAVEPLTPSFPPEGQCSVTVLCCCSSSHTWLHCNSAGPLCLPSSWPIVGCVLGKKWIFSRRREAPKQLKCINVFYLFCFFLSLIVHIKGEYFFSQYTFQQTILSNHQR